ncbi:MAG: hypothetical protein RI985_2159 [Chloroflexota bacterium]|jgi:cell division protein FtsB
MRTTTIILVALLVLSVIANAVLGYTSVNFFVKSNQQELTIAQQKQTLTDTQTTLASTITQYNAVVEELNQANSTNKTLTTRVGQLEDESTRTAKTLNDYRDRLAKADYFVSRAKCEVMVDELKAFGANSNNDIKQSILVALESMYGGSITSSNYTTYWNNNKSAMLTTVWGPNGSTKTIVAWDNEGNNIQSIFDVGAGCIMYTGDRGNSW